MQNAPSDTTNGQLFGSPVVTVAFSAAGILLAAVGALLWQQNGAEIFLDLMLSGLALCA